LLYTETNTDNNDAYIVKGGEFLAKCDITDVFNRIYDATNNKVLVYITVKCGNTADIKDIFQDTYLELFSVVEKRGTCYIENGEAFVMRIAKQKIYRYYTLLDRLKSVVSLAAINSDGEEYDLAEMADMEADSFVLEDIIAEKELISRVSRFLSKKPETVKKVFYLFYYMDLSIPEISSQLSMSESSVKNKIYRTIKELRQLYK